MNLGINLFTRRRVHGKVMGIALFAAWLALGAAGSFALGDGGAVRCSERRDDRLITVFTAPTPLRAGPVDISVLVQDADSGRPLPDVATVVQLHPIHHAGRTVSAPATIEAATNKLWRAAQVEISEPGLWRVEVVVQGGCEGPPIGFDVDVAEARPPWLDMSLWIGWPLVAIGFFSVHQLLVQKRQRLMLHSGTKPPAH